VTGGDAYDLWKINEQKLGIFLADASGHGLAPALEVSQARTLARALSDINCDPRWVLTHINGRLAQDLKLGHFVTVFLGCLACDGKLMWSSAGHGPILYRRSPESRIEILEPPAPPVGIDDVFPVDQTEVIDLEPGGILVVMSDGIFEAQDQTGEMFGVERVTEILDRCQSDSPANTLACIRDSVKAWQGKTSRVPSGRA
jgi:phosphoserine phosphatase